MQGIIQIKKRLLVILIVFIICSGQVVMSQEESTSGLEATFSKQSVSDTIDDYFCSPTCASTKDKPVCCEGKKLLCPGKYKEGLFCLQHSTNPNEILPSCAATNDGHVDYTAPGCIDQNFCVSEDCSLVCDSNAAYFEFIVDPWPHTFVVKITDRATIAEARRILAGNNGVKTHVAGIVVKSPAPYNAPWSYHLDPSTIYFFERAVEVCDGYFAYVEEHLDIAGGAFLPGLRFCPWHSEILREVTCSCNCVSVPPILRSVTPNTGKAGDRIKIIVTGIKPEDLSASKVKVYFGTTVAVINNASNLSNGRDTQLNVTVPNGTKVVDITVTNVTGQRSLNALKFTYQK